jgi:hypothetical protein
MNICQVCFTVQIYNSTLTVPSKQKKKNLFISSFTVTRNSFFRRITYEIALHHQLDYFITGVSKHFKTIQKATLPVINAKAFNKIIQ